MCKYRSGLLVDTYTINSMFYFKDDGHVDLTRMNPVQKKIEVPVVSERCINEDPAERVVVKRKVKGNL